MKNDLIVIVIISLLVLAFLSPMLFNHLGIFFDDYYETFTGLYFNARSLQQGVIPLWNPQTFAGGRPRFIPNTTVWHWPIYLFCLLTPLSNVNLAYLTLIKLPLTLQWLLCALTAYGLGRNALRLHPVGAMVLALVFSFGSAMSYNICDPSTVYATAWIPLALWGIVSYARSGNRMMGIIGALAISFIGPCGSEVRGIFSLSTVAVTIAVLAAINVIQGSGRVFRRLLFSGVVLFLIGLLLSGPYWTAMIDAFSIFRGTSLLDFEYAASRMFSMPWRHLISLPVPDLFGTLTQFQQVNLGIPDLSEYLHIEGNITGGFWLLMLCVAGSFAGRRSRSSPESEPEQEARRWWIAGLGLFILSILLITGRYSIVYRCLARLLPVIGLPYAVRWRIMGHVGLAFLAGVSAHWLWTSRRAISRLSVVIYAVIVLGAVVWQWSEKLSPGNARILTYALEHYRGWFWGEILPYLGGGVVLTFILIILAGKRIARVLLIAAASLETVLIGFVVVYFLSYADVPEWVRYRTPTESDYYKWTDHPFLTNLPPSRTGQERTAFYFSMLDQMATVHGGDYLLGHPAKPLGKRLRGVLRAVTSGYPYALRITNPASRFFPNMSVRYLVLQGPQALRDLAGEPRELSGTDGIYSHRLRDTMPRVFTQDRIVECTAEEARSELMGGDLRRSAFLEIDPDKTGDRSDEPWAKAGEVMSYDEFKERGGDNEAVVHFEELQKSNRIDSVRLPTPNRMVIEMRVEKPSLLITTDVWYPGWEVKVDGSCRRPSMVNYLQRGVWLERGNHLIEWSFHPPAVKWGFALVGLGLLGIVGILIWPHSRTVSCSDSIKNPEFQVSKFK